MTNTENNQEEEEIQQSRIWAGKAMNGDWDGNGRWHLADKKWSGNGKWKLGYHTGTLSGKMKDPKPR